jgi:hypothetical protein
VASTPIELSEVPSLIGVLVDALGDAIKTPEPEKQASVRPPSLLDGVRKWLRPKLATVSELRIIREQSENREVG